MPIQNVLVVDDSRTELIHLSEILEQAGYSVTTAENGEQALAQVQLAQRANEVMLYKSLGGGWMDTDANAPGAAAAPDL